MTGSVGVGRRRVIVHDRGFLLAEIAFPADFGPGSAHVPSVRSFAVRQQHVSVPRPQRASGHADSSAQSLSRLTLGDYVDDARVAVRFVACRGSRNDLDIRNGRGGNLFHSPGSFLYGGFAVHIDEKARTASERHFSVGVHPDRGSRAENVGRRSSRRRQGRGAADPLSVQLIDDPASGTCDGNAFEPVFLGHERDGPHVDRTAAAESDRVARVRPVAQ